MFLVEIILTIVAWKRGWKARALIPLAIAFSVGLIAGIIIGANGGTEAPAEIMIVDIGALIALIIMSIKKPTPKISQS